MLEAAAETPTLKEYTDQQVLLRGAGWRLFMAMQVIVHRTLFSPGEKKAKMRRKAKSVEAVVNRWSSHRYIQWSGKSWGWSWWRGHQTEEWTGVTRNMIRRGSMIWEAVRSAHFMSHTLVYVFNRLNNPTQQLIKQTICFSTPCQGHSKGAETLVSGTLPITMVVWCY